MNTTTTTDVVIDVRGIPRPQGSMQHFANGGARYPANVYVWRGKVQAAAAAVMDGKAPLEGPIELHLGFDLARPAAHFGTGRNAGVVKVNAPASPAKMPDLDKLIRCVSDALTDAGVWHDDGQVVLVHAAKRYGPRPGVRIGVTATTYHHTFTTTEGTTTT